MITLRLPWPPSVNHYYAPTRKRGFLRLTQRAKDYRDEVWAAVMQQGRPAKPLTGSLAVRMVARPPDRRVRDLDNVWKGALDSLRHAGVIEDDKFIDRLEIERVSPTPDGELVVTIEHRGVANGRRGDDRG